MGLGSLTLVQIALTWIIGRQAGSGGIMRQYLADEALSGIMRLRYWFSSLFCRFSGGFALLSKDFDMKRAYLGSLIAALMVWGWISMACAEVQADPYAEYVRMSKDFKRVKQGKAWALKAWPSWTYMPWTYKWNIGYSEAAGAWAAEHGYNGAFLDHGQTIVGRADKLAWINKFRLRFYVDHTASKGYLHLWDGGGMQKYADLVHGAGVRVRPVNVQMKQKLCEIIRKYVENVKSSPFRAAYALDDEISWGHFVHPCMWRITDDLGAYKQWLREIYGPGNVPERDDWITYDSIWPKLKNWAVKDFDCSQLMDQWTFNDSYWNNFLGDLVEYSNSIDPQTPCGYVGGQSPNAFGGYDYAKLMRKIQFIEAYNVGGSQAIIRSFNPNNALPAVTTHFHKGIEDTIWQTWYYLAHGNRGFIGWVEGWFDGDKAKDWHEAVGPHYIEAGETIGPLMSGAEWIHDGVALYYSHASIQLGWIMDAEAHRKTWRNRNGDHRLGGSHTVRHAWENMLRDEGLGYDFISYVDVIQKGIPKEYKVLILPATLCLSEAEARRIEEFCRRGGTVIADYLPGLWDQHGRGRKGSGVLDDMFGVEHDMDMGAADVFGTRLWAEVDQDTNFNWKTYQGFLTNQNDCVKDSSGFHKAVRKMPVGHVNQFGKGTAVLMNLSPQWYNAYREAGYADALKRETFIKHIKAAGIEAWVRIDGAGEETHGYEITYWAKGGRTILFVCLNPELAGSSLGGGNSVGLKSGKSRIRLTFNRAVSDVRDERTGRVLPDGKDFSFDWTMNEAVVISFAGQPQR